jgi:23S rRNA pseudouridine1911/1915/1917 synthase
MDKYEFKVSGTDKGMRLDIYLHGKFPVDISRTAIQEMIKEGLVLVNNLQTKPHHKIKENDVVSLTVLPPKEIDLLPEDIQLDIVFEDNSILVVNKPAGMVVHPGAGVYSGTLVNALLAHAHALSSVGGKFKPGIVHRLDKDTSGLLLVAKTDPIHLALAKQFQEHTILRRYIALVKASMELDEGEVDVPISRSLRDRTRMNIDFAAGRKAVSFYRVLKRYQDYTLIEVYPRTGRTHQIRVHMAYLGHPVLGDIVYGSKSTAIKRQALHAREIGFRHPLTQENMKFSSSLPEDMRRLVADYTID